MTKRVEINSILVGNAKNVYTKTIGKNSTPSKDVRKSRVRTDSLIWCEEKNVQFAHNPKTGRVVIIEINPRTSRSSALASKATGFPIALISAKLASGLTLDEIPYWRDGTLEKYTPGGAPDGDYIVLKFARWAFEKFRGVEDSLGTSMKAVGEVMSIGKTFKETFQKAIRGLENGRSGLGFAKDFNRKSAAELCEMLRTASSERYFQLYEAIRKGVALEKLEEITHVKMYFLQQMKELVDLEEEMLKNPGRVPADELLVRAKKDGFSDKYLSKILKVSEKAIRDRRKALGVRESWLAVPVSGVENASYYYSTYNTDGVDDVYRKVPVFETDKYMLRQLDGDKDAQLVWEALCYNIVKYIGSMAVVLQGKVDGILITGRYTRFRGLIDYIRQYTGWIAPVYIYENEVEQEAMCAGALRVLRGEEEARVYTGKDMIK